MEVTPLGIEGSWLAQSPLLSDNRGYFREWFNLNQFEEATGRSMNFEQANVSQSVKGAVRGIHYSIAERGQAKWITCVNGSIRDFIVDLRSSSQTFGMWISVELNAECGSAILISEGLGHAFLSLEENTTVVYLCSTAFSPKDEFGINPMDPDIAIDWGPVNSELILSEKDRLAPTLQQRLIDGKLPS